MILKIFKLKFLFLKSVSIIGAFNICRNEGSCSDRQKNPQHSSTLAPQSRLLKRGNYWVPARFQRMDLINYLPPRAFNAFNVFVVNDNRLHASYIERNRLAFLDYLDKRLL